MKTRCRRIEEKLQDYLDRTPDGSTAERGLAGFSRQEIEHLRLCKRCRKLHSDYPSFRATLRSEADVAIVAMPAPDWQGILAEGRTRAGLEDPAARTRPVPGRRSALRRFTVSSPKPILTAAAALFLLTIGAAGFAGYHQYRVIQARALVRTDTSAFVDSLFAAPFFPAAAQSPSAIGVDSAWFEVAGVPTVPPPASQPAGGPAGAAATAPAPTRR